METKGYLGYSSFVAGVRDIILQLLVCYLGAFMIFILVGNYELSTFVFVKTHSQLTN